MREVALHRRLDARQSPRDQAANNAIVVEHRQSLARVMPEPGIRFLALVGQFHPGLAALPRAAVTPEFFETIGVGYAATVGPHCPTPQPHGLFGGMAASSHLTHAH